MKLAIAADHAGYQLKEQVKANLLKQGYEVQDFGTDSDKSVDYPDFIQPLARAVENKEADMGVIMCGSGNGVNMTANKYQGVRSALCWTEEIAKLARQHNDANVIALPARFMEPEEAMKAVNTFINTGFEGGRHATRVNKIAKPNC